LGGHKKIWGVIAPECPPVATGVPGGLCVARYKASVKR